MERLGARDLPCVMLAERRLMGVAGMMGMTVLVSDMKKPLCSCQ
jgi:hypothetical protein